MGIPADKTNGATDRIAGRSLFFFFLCLYLLTGHGFLETPDAEVEYQTTRGIVLHGDPALVPELGPLTQAILAADKVNGTQGFGCAPGVDKRYYSWFGIGHSLWGIPFYIVGKGMGALFPGVEAAFAGQEFHTVEMQGGLKGEEYFAHFMVSLSHPLAAALICWVLFGLARVLGLKRSTAIIVTLVYGAGTMAWPFSRESLSDGPATLFALLCLRDVFYWQRGKGSTGLLVRAGIWAGLMVLIRVMLGLYLVPICLYLLWSVFRQREQWFANLLRFALPLVGFVVLLMAYNWWRFHDLFESGYGEQYTKEFFSFPLYYGIPLLVFAPGKGLLPFCLPLLGLLCLIGSPRKPGRAETLLFFGLLLVIMFPIAKTTSWHGGMGWGPRYLLPALPPLILLTGYAWEGMAGRACWVGLVLRGSFMLGLLISLGGVISPVHGWFAAGFDAARRVQYKAQVAANPALVGHLCHNVFSGPHYSPIVGHWRYLATNLQGGLVPGGTPGLAEDWFDLAGEPTLALAPFSRQHMDFRHFWFVDLADRFRLPWIYFLPLGLLGGVVFLWWRLGTLLRCAKGGSE